MDQFVEFVGNHVVLFIALLVVSGLLIQNLLASAGGKGFVDSLGATALINREEAVVVDVRSMNDFSNGHIINAINLPINGFKDQLGKLKKYQERPIIIHCRSGAQSGAAGKALRKEGFTKVYELKGGILAWQSANLPVSHK